MQWCWVPIQQGLAPYKMPKLTKCTSYLIKMLTKKRGKRNNPRYLLYLYVSYIYMSHRWYVASVSEILERRDAVILQATPPSHKSMRSLHAPTIPFKIAAKNYPKKKKLLLLHLTITQSHTYNGFSLVFHYCKRKLICFSSANTRQWNFLITNKRLN